MIPKYGGTPLPDAPDCLAADHGKALAYVGLLAAALNQSGWSAHQRDRIRAKYRKWLLCAEGRDPYFEQWGTFPRMEGMTPPTATDLVVAGWRRRFPRTPEERKRRVVPKRLRHGNGGSE